MEHGATFWDVPAENFREQREILKSIPVVPDALFRTEMRVTFMFSMGHL